MSTFFSKIFEVNVKMPSGCSDALLLRERKRTRHVWFADSIVLTSVVHVRDNEMMQVYSLKSIILI